MSSSTAILAPPAEPTPTLIYFARGVIAILALWPVLRLAVDEKWGGSSSAAKRQWLASVIVDNFESDPMDVDDLEETLLQVLSDEFEVIVEDDTSEKIAQDIVRIWGEVSEGKYDRVLALEVEADKKKGKKVQADQQEGNGDSDYEGLSEDDDVEEGDEAPQLIQTSSVPKPEPVVDEEGFTLVQGKGR